MRDRQNVESRIAALCRHFFAGILLLVLFAGLIVACAKEQKSPEKKPVPVTASPAVSKDVPVEIRAVGNVEAYSTVSVKSRIGGILSRVHFREGQDVKKGVRLFTIDPRPYEAEVKRAEANLLRDTAQLENARRESGRYSELVKHGYATQQQYEQMATNVATLEAGVNADRAVLENARLQLKYCYIDAPLSGRTGDLMADEGNLIKSDADSPMVVINQIQPVYVTIAVPEQYLQEIKNNSAGRLEVRVSAGNGGGETERGSLTFFDNFVDSETGTIRLKAEFANKERRLWPGQFVEAVITLSTRKDAVVVPSQAVQSGQKGQYVFVIKNDLTVEDRPVQTGITFRNETVIENGLQTGEKVVTDGHLRLTPGSKVEVKNKAG